MMQVREGEDIVHTTIETPDSMARAGNAFLDVDGRRSVAFPRFEADETISGICRFIGGSAERRKIQPRLHDTRIIVMRWE